MSPAACRGTGLNEATIARRIREQEAAGQALDRLSVKECEDPFAK